MSDHLLCCPRCSLLPPVGIHLTPEQHRGAFFSPRVHVGRRSNKCWLHARIGCNHKPELAGPLDTPEAISTPWNRWVRTEALVVAKERNFTGDRLAQWLAGLGISPK